MEFLKDVFPREYQKTIAETCLKKNCLVVIPTGLGKTLIALIVAVERIKQYPSEKVLFLAPTKPLVEQHFKYFKEHLTELFGEMQFFTGNINPEKRKKIWENSNIVFSTPQCIANDLKNQLYDLNEICLLIEDEAHRCLNNYDYNYVAQQYKIQAKNQRIIGLTASPGSEMSKIKEICKNLSIEEVELRTRESPDVKPYLQELKFEKVLVDFPIEFEKIRDGLRKIFNGCIDELRSRSVLFGISSKTELIKLQKRISISLSSGNKNFNYIAAASVCARALKLQHALELLETQTLKGFVEYMSQLLEQAEKKQSKAVIKLTSSKEFISSLKMAKDVLAKGVEHPKIEKTIEVVKNENLGRGGKTIIFTQFRDTASLISKKISDELKLNSKIFVGQAKKKNTGLNQKEQRKILDEFAEGKINVLCATCIGEEGIDIPEVNTVVFYEPVASAIRTIQRAGRTARLMKGKLIILVTRKTRDESYYYVSKAKEKRMHSAISTIKDELKDNALGKQKTFGDF
ncbi:DEAD/DEAH box helicase [Candidatus Pacearchaeota archaeon]|nr:DEAD/DEAH box helicase [Candidatus Pacearchaeota archaeon]